MCKLKFFKSIFDFLQGQEEPEVLAQMTREDIISNYVASDEEVLNTEPVLKPQPRLLSLDDKILLSVARANVLSQITVSPELLWPRPSCDIVTPVRRLCLQMLNLHGNSLSTAKEISSLTALRHLTISFNKFTRLDDVCHMVARC